MLGRLNLKTCPFAEERVDESAEGGLTSIGEFVTRPHHRLVERDESGEIERCGAEMSSHVVGSAGVDFR